MRLGNEAAKFVSAAFPNPMELKFERIAQPFMLLHVNRCSADMPPLCLTSSYSTTRESIKLWGAMVTIKILIIYRVLACQEVPWPRSVDCHHPNGYLVENSLGHAVSGLLDAKSCNHDCPCTCVGSCYRGKLMQTCCRAGGSPLLRVKWWSACLPSSSTCMTSLV